MTDNPLLAPSDLPYGLPLFDRISDEHFLPAFETALAEHRAEIAAIVDDPEPPSFENTIVALECSGQLLHRVSQILFNLTAADANDARRAVQTEIAPRLAAHSDAVHLDAALFARVDAVHARRDELDLTPEQDWLLHRTHVAFTRAGAGLPEDKQARLRELNEELSRLETRFQDNLLADTNELAVLVSTRDELAGLSDDAVTAAAEAATARGEDGKYLLTLGLPSAQPVLASLENRDLRKRVFTASVSRGGRGNEHDNKEILATIARLRAERAAVLGYPNHAAYAIEDQTAGSAEAAVSMLERLAPAAVANANAEAAELQEDLAADGVEGELQPWDWAYYAERVRKRRFDIDDAALRPYFELERVLVDGVFHAAGKLYGLTFAERSDLAGYHPDVRVWEVFDADGGPLGLYLGDFFTRDAKRGGAWMNNLVEQSRLLGQRPVVVNNLNITKPADGEPALLTYDEVTTLFHEFGHALHGLVSDVEYQSLEGTNVPRDFVEFPSQVNEMWALWPEVLANYARHHRTGEPLPQETAAKLEEASRYGEGFRTTEYLAASLLDLAWHTIGPDAEVDDVDRFEAEALQKAGVALATVPPRYRSTYFAHVFSNAYAAGYYSYIWSEVLDAESVEWFRENGGLARENGDRFRAELLAKGGSVDVMEAFRAFRGRDPQLQPLLERRGLTAA
ncbi:peptidyl-dipeptidase Dcp [Prauserella aidingensis]|uniref:M3 family metallopeptidase n=1 Tax=Prauserella aidingensis TaxID=387890 RepID=UPI0020A603C2|nr:M3 family metallopeptidase [Prauserella aidingensis]MCP2251433.1 peptidyl-dipeptidase Dcp [Prauserella aidingensis]